MDVGAAVARGWRNRAPAPAQYVGPGTVLGDCPKCWHCLYIGTAEWWSTRHVQIFSVLIT